MRPLLAVLLSALLALAPAPNVCPQGTTCTCHTTAHECYLDTQCVHERDQVTGEVKCVALEKNSKIKGCWYGGCEGAVPIEGEEFW